jgi:4-amino-4-deoxy-L-arabinose transferase-like glycosyltransferase
VNVISTQSRPARRHARAGSEPNPAWARPALIGLLLATAVLYLAGLSRSGYANEFYAAAVQAGTKSWKAFLFGSLDSSNFITVDKTPASLWVMELSGRIFGFNSWSLLVPQALEGVAAVGVLYAAVRRWFGAPAGLIAGAVLAITPVAALMFRFDNPDALLVLVMTLAGYAITRAIESGRTRWVLLTGALLGLGYLTKMLQAFLVLPAFALAYLWAGQPALGKRIWQLLAGAGALVAAAGWWVVIDLLTPAADRPYAGGSTDNNILQLTFGYNGLGRLDGTENSPGGGAGGGGNSLFGGATGITRLFQSDMGSQISWLLPAALIMLAALVWLTWRRPRTDRLRAAVLLWGGWLVLTGLVFSYMSGIIHPYYTVALAPAIGALVGIGAVALWRIRDRWPARAVLAGTVLITVGWAWVLLGRSDWMPWLRVVIAVAGAAAAGLILAGGARTRGTAAFAIAPISLALIAGLAGPLAYSIDTAATPHSGSIPTAGPTATGGAGGGFPGGSGLPSGSVRPGSGELAAGQPGAGRPSGAPSGTGQPETGSSGTRLSGQPGAGGGVSSALSRLLESGASGYRWAAATVGSTSAASLELSSDGVPVMAIGGFSGSDPAPTLAEFKAMVAAHEIHYFVASGGGAGAGGPGGGSGYGSQITSWVKQHYTARTVGGMTVYDLTKAKA